MLALAEITVTANSPNCLISMENDHDPRRPRVAPASWLVQWEVSLSIDHASETATQTLGGALERRA